MVSENIMNFQLWNKKLMVPLLELFIFSTIRNKTSYGAELVELSQKKLDENIKIPTVYALLKKSTQNGLLTNEEHVKEFDKPYNKKTRGIARRYYDITIDGIKHLNMIQNRMKEICNFFQEEQL